MTHVMATLVLALIAVGGPHLALAASDDVSATTRAWIDAMNSRDPEKVVALYDDDAVLWATVSPVIRDTRQAIREAFNFLRTVQEYKIVLGEQRVRVYGDMAINTGTYTVSAVPRDGKPVTLPARFSFVYRNRNGRWMIVDHHSSAMPAPPQ
jgi:uncharacterized protein (TIGR02246 family)